MRPWNTPSPPRASAGRAARPAAALALAASLVLALGACVTRGTYDEAAGERDRLRASQKRLQAEVERLSASNRSLEADRVSLLEQMEDLRLEHENLEADHVKLRRRENTLATDLERREAELAARNAELQQLRGTYEGLVEDLEAEVAAGAIEIEQLREGLRLNLSQSILFPSGSVDLNANGKAVLVKVAKRLAKLPHGVEVQGHTDNVPIQASARKRFPSNWELAAGRAAGVVRLLGDNGVDPARLSAVSFGQERPVASNDTPQGRAKNRRIEIRLEPMGGSAPGEIADAS